jgi:histone acetyltransferase
MIRNDDRRDHLKWLLDLKNIFANQLPKMPREYISKLVFDRSHESMIILRNHTSVLGGICFREFKQEGFAEIAFLAITSSEQVRGFGTRLMNKLKGSFLFTQRKCRKER